MIPYGRQEVTEADIAAVEAVLRSEYLTQGPTVPRFEQAVARYCRADRAVAVNSATSALHLACMALELGPGDWLWTTPNTFVASANCARYCGASVDFVDIDPRTYNLCPEHLATKLAMAEREGRLPKLVMPVHFSGQSCDMEAIGRLAEQYGFRIIEDASHAIGGSYGGERVGCCRHSDITVFSFHPVKIITTGEGGMALTNDGDLAARMERLRNHGITKDPEALTESQPGAWYYEQQALGYNYRMTDMQAALGLSQLDRLDAYVARRRDLAGHYDELLAGLPLVLPWQAERDASAWHLYVIRLKVRELGMSRGEVFQGLRDAGIRVQVHYIPVHTQPYYRALGFEVGQFAAAEDYYKEAVSIPMYPSLTSDELERVAGVLRAQLTSGTPA